MDAFALVLAFVLVALNAFFVAAEFAIVKIRPSQIEEMVRKNRPGARIVRKTIGNIDASLSACQLGITIASLALGRIGEPAFERLLHPFYDLIGLTDPTWIKWLTIILVLAIITFLHITVGEQAPKTLAILRPETVILATAYPLMVFSAVFYPFVWLINNFSLLMVRATGVNPAEEHGNLPSEEELKVIVQQARSAGLMSAARSEVLRKAMNLPSKSARHLMVPRNEVAFLDINLSFEQNLERARNAQHTRLPLCDRELDDVIGVIDIRDVLFRAREGSVDLEKLATPVHYFPELMSGERLLGELRNRHISMAVIVDEYGGASGIVTPADVIAAVLGDFDDQDDPDVVRLPGGAYDVDGTATIEEVEQALKITIETDDMRTVAGFLMGRLGRMPRAGDEVIEGPFVFHVVNVTGPRIDRIRIQRQHGAKGRRQTIPPT